jgi:excisionase family DNA binding protein
MTGLRKYFRAVEIAEFTGLALRTVQRRIADSTFPSTKLGGARLVAKADLEAAFSPAEADSPEDQNDDDSQGRTPFLAGAAGRRRGESIGSRHIGFR